MQKRQRAPLMYAISRMFENEVKTYVNDVNRKTGIPKSRIITNIVIERIRAEKNLQKNIGNIGK